MVTTGDSEPGLEADYDQVDGRVVDLRGSVCRLRTDLIAGLDRMEAKLNVILILTIVIACLAWVNLVILIVRG